MLKENKSSYEDKLTTKLQQKNIEFTKKINQKSMKKILKISGLILSVILLSLISHLMRIYLPPSFIVHEDFDINAKVQNYDVAVPDKGYYDVGLYLGRKFELDMNKKNNDGNFTIEYYNNGVLLRKKEFHRWTKELITIKGTIPMEIQNKYKMVLLDEINVPKNFKVKKFTIKIITHKGFSFFSKIRRDKSKKVDFFLKRRSEIFYQNQKTPEELKKLLLNMYPENIKINEFYDSNKRKLPLLRALFDKDVNSVKRIIEQNNGIGVDTILGGEEEIRRSNQRTALFYAAYFNDVVTLKYLVEKGANIRHQDISRKYPIAYAIENNSIEATKFFLDLGIKTSEINYVYNKNERRAYAPLSFAFSIGSYELAKLLLEHNATNRYPNPNKKYRGNNNKTYGFISKFDNYKKMLDLLLKYKIEGKDKPSKEELISFYNSRVLDSLSSAPINKNLTLKKMSIELFYEELYFEKQQEKK